MSPVDFTNPLDAAIGRWPELEVLRYLDGWSWHTGPATLIGELALGDGWFNALVMYAPDDAYAARLRANAGDSQDVVWFAEGTLATVLATLAGPPSPGSPDAPTLARPVVLLPPTTGE